MDDPDEFAVWVARSMLEATNNDVQVQLLDDLSSQARSKGDLDEVVAESSKNTRRSGDFGVEFVAALLVPVLIEVGKQLWAAYAKKFYEEVGGGLAKLTVDKAKQSLRALWSGEDKSAALERAETILREVGTKEGLSQGKIDALVAALRDGRVLTQLQSS